MTLASVVSSPSDLSNFLMQLLFCYEKLYCVTLNVTF